MRCRGRRTDRVCRVYAYGTARYVLDGQQRVAVFRVATARDVPGFSRERSQAVSVGRRGDPRPRLVCVSGPPCERRLGCVDRV